MSRQARSSGVQHLGGVGCDVQHLVEDDHVNRGQGEGRHIPAHEGGPIVSQVLGVADRCRREVDPRVAPERKPVQLLAQRAPAAPDIENVPSLCEPLEVADQDAVARQLRQRREVVESLRTISGLPLFHRPLFGAIRQDVDAPGPPAEGADNAPLSRFETARLARAAPGTFGLAIGAATSEDDLTHRARFEMRTMSIAIPSHQRREPLIRLLRELGEQMAGSTELSVGVEIIVVLDGSTDGSREAVESLELPVPVICHWQPNRGRAKRRGTPRWLPRGERSSGSWMTTWPPDQASSPTTGSNMKLVRRTCCSARASRTPRVTPVKHGWTGGPGSSRS